jgi:hypothetical protein
MVISAKTKMTAKVLMVVLSLPIEAESVRHFGEKLKFCPSRRLRIATSRLSDIEPQSVCKACGKQGADIRPDVHASRRIAAMGYR